MKSVDFDVQSGRVRFMGLEVTVTEKEKALLVALIDAQGRVLSKEALIAQIWPARAGWVESGNLTQLVSKLRKSLRPIGLDAAIVTCGRHGYQYARPHDEREAALPSGVRQRARRSAPAAMAVMGSMVAVCALGLWLSGAIGRRKSSKEC